MNTNNKRSAVFATGATLMTLALVAAATPVNGMTTTDPYAICRNVTDLYGGLSDDGHLTTCQVLEGVNGERVNLDWIGNIELQGVIGHGLLRAVNNLDPSGFVPDPGDGGTGDAVDTVLTTAGGSQGGGVTACYPGMIVCAMAGADSHIEVLGSVPDSGFMMTMGGGQSGNIFPGSAQIQTSLGSGSCSFDAWHGCMVQWMNITSHGSCSGTWANTLATAAIFAIAASASDPICEKGP